MNRPAWSSIFRRTRVGSAAPRLATLLATVAAALTATLTVFAAVFLLLAFPSSALADDSSLGVVGGDYYPLSNTDIRMESETVQAICYRYFAEYRADFLFVNSGPVQTLMLGFPFALDEPDGWSQGPIAFRAWQDGKPLAVSLGQGPAEGVSQGYYLHQATFPQGPTMITVSYLGNPSWTASDRFPELAPPTLTGAQGQAGRYDYWLHTGAGWAGTIGTGVVRFTLADDFRGWGLDVKADYPGIEGGWPWTTRPETYTQTDDRTYQWAFKELEPTEQDDILLGFTGAIPMADPGTSISPAFGAIVSSISASDPALSTLGDGWSLIDGSPASAVGPLAKDAWLKLNITGDQKLAEIRIVPGDNTTLESFRESGRPKRIKMTLSDGTTAVLNLIDEPSVQKFPINGAAEWVRLDLLESYPGTRTAGAYISDVSFGNAPAPVFEPFDTLIAEAAAVTPTTAPITPTTGTPPTSLPPTTSPSPVTSAVSPATSAPSVPTTSSPATTAVTQPVTAAAGETDSVWTVWPIVFLAIAGAALVLAVVLIVMYIRRRPQASPPPA